MQLRRLIAFAALAACHKEGPSADRAQTTAPEAAPVTPPPAPIVTGSAGAAPMPPPAGPPPGTDKLTNVPSEIASKLELVEVVRGLARPVLLVVAPGDTKKRMYIVEQHAGRVRVLENGKLSATPFFTMDRKISTGNEQGLLGLAFHPEFQKNGLVYINYTADDKDTHIVEYKVASGGEKVDVSTRREIVEIDQPYSNHNGGHVAFGPDGKLYTGMGDGGSAGDPLKAGQNPKMLLAKILRFDVSAAKPVPEIVHMGVRNPWRFSFDPMTSALYIGDVGQNAWEYVFVVSGTDGVSHNFGWNIIEGSHCYGARTCDKTGFTLPVAEYPHDDGCSITGGFVYRGKALPELDGHYFYADYCTGLLRSFKWTDDTSTPIAPGWIRDHWGWKGALDRKGVLSQVSSFGIDHDGELHIVLLTGSIYKLARRP
ncbi:MAG: PQQ-dependent sugar dehydrogenase [Myxococcota bacterium]|nr:PQQ-dependent sugar dehydrogenase [Myxococcota bacterium]